MTEESLIPANFWDESAGYRNCCGKQSKTTWGNLEDSSGAKVIYFFQWTVNDRYHMPCFDIVLGPWGDGTAPSDHVLVSLQYQSRPGGGSFMVAGGKGRRADDRNLCGRAPERADVIGTPLANDVFAFADAVWLTEPRIEQIRALDNFAHAGS